MEKGNPMGYEEIQATAKIDSVIKVISDDAANGELGPMHEFMISNLEDVKALLLKKR